MPRGLTYLLAWGAATTLTVAASWLGINSVVSSAAPPRTSPLSAAELRRAAPTPTAPAPSPTPVRPAPVPSVPPSRPPTPSALPPPRPAPVSTGWTPESDGRGGTAYRRTFRMQGGDVMIWFARGEIRVLSAVAKAGFAIDVRRPSLDSTTVTFFSSRHRSRIWASWRDGPYAELNEGDGASDR